MSNEITPVETGESQQNTVTYFAQLICSGETAVNDGQLGLRVVEMLEAPNRSTRSQGRRVILRDQAIQVPA